MSVKTLKTNTTTWHYLSDVKEAELTFLRTNFKFHSLDFKDLAGEVQRSKIDIYRNYVFMVLRFPSGVSRGTAHETLREDQLFIFAGKDYVITIATGKNKMLNNLYYKVANNQRLRDEYSSGGSGFMLYKILERLVRQSWADIYRLDSPLRELEQHIDEGQRKLVFDIARLRRLVLQYKALADPQRLVIHTLTTMKETFLGKELSEYFDDIDDYLDKTWASLVGYEQRIMSLHDIYESLISFQTNRVMKILTIFSVAFLPLTLITGIYGMNIDLPLGHMPQAVWTGFIGTAVLIIGGIAYSKYKDWI